MKYQWQEHTWRNVYIAKIALMEHPFDIPKIDGLENYLPLIAISWSTASNPHLLGIDPNGVLLFAHINFINPFNQSGKMHCELNCKEHYPDMKTLFAQAIERGFQHKQDTHRDLSSVDKGSTAEISKNSVIVH